MTARIEGCIVGFSDDVQSGITQHCAKCGAVTTKWFPWPGMWLCRSCFINTNSTDLHRLKEKSNVNETKDI